ncbi:hypothetical protein ABH935_006315 [Catenulispora sp. GAS73]|uniref:ATP-binding protein n=1 Tax=Catenulispora sp. GAS73 TaxID=3156269 RepID=UPI0035182BD1
MSGARPDGRGEEHLRALAAAISDVLRRLDAHAESKQGSDKEADGGRPSAEAAGTSGATALDTVTACFGLTPFERDLLVLAAAAEIDPRTPAACAAASGPELGYPTFGLGLAALSDPHWSALTPVAPLRRWMLLSIDESNALTSARIHIDERVLHFLLGAPYLDPRLHGLIEATPRPDALPTSQHVAAERIAAVWQRPDSEPRVEIVGADRQTRIEIAAHAAATCGLRLYAVRAGELPADPTDRDALARLWEREAVLLPAALLVDVDGPEDAARAEAVLAAGTTPFALSSPDPLPTLRVHRERVGATMPTTEEQHVLWASTLNGTAALAEPKLRELVAQFSLPAHVIRAAGVAVRHAAEGQDAAADQDPGELLWRAGLAEARMGLADLGRRVEPRASWDDLVLPTAQRTILREIVAHVRQRATVYRDWGFDAVLRRGLGVTALFAGGSGTGKTLAAEVVARELGLDLFVIDLSQVVSKFIGETEKNLRKVFDGAERGGALLLFDEADALFGKRSEVKDSHDRYANLEVSYLLMRMEEYRGLAILTTNMKKALDSAFMRRIRFVVDFPFPDIPERAEIWRRVIPEQTPARGLDPALLARLTVAGGSIRNIALAAAFLAADEGEELQMRHMLAAARTEYLKQERSLPPGEVAGWI